MLTAALAALLLWLAAPAAQSATPHVPEVLQEAVDVGVSLERAHNWRDAIAHYEAALERWPDDRHLTYGLRRARFQYSIDRRYSDQSFRNEMLPLSRDRAMGVFDDVVSRIQRYFVEPVSIESMVAHGTESLWLALANERFRQQNLNGAEDEPIREVRQALREQYWNRPLADRAAARGMIFEVCDLLKQRLGVAEGVVVMEYVFGACNGLDDYSNVMTPARHRDLYDNISGEFVGIGIVIEGDLGHGMSLVDVLPESPAEEQGLQPGEWIAAINGRDCRFLETEEAANLLAGLPGTSVRLTVTGRDGEARREVTCTRREVHVKSIPVATMIDSAAGIAYLRMSSFQSGTPAELDAALRRLRSEGMRSMVWDLRGNPGGLLSASVSVLDRFIADGTLVSTRGRVSDQNSTYTAFSPGTWDVPLVLLIDENSASASEIVAGAIRDHHRGTIVGRTSFGKWSVQTPFGTQGSYALRLTTARFYSPSGNTYGKLGIRPDVVVELDASADEARRRLPTRPADVNAENDPDLRAALDVLRPRSTRRP